MSEPIDMRSSFASTLPQPPKRNDGGPAFPTSTRNMFLDGGLSLRDWFAGMALQGMQANVGANKWGPDKFSEAAYRCADAMLKARNA